MISPNNKFFFFFFCIFIFFFLYLYIFFLYLYILLQTKQFFSEIQLSSFMEKQKLWNVVDDY